MKTFKLAQTAVAVLALSAGSAQAVLSPFVTQWEVGDTAAFVPTSVLPATNPNNTPVNSYPNPVLTTNLFEPGNGANTQLTWGVPANDLNAQSSIRLDSSGSPYTVDTNILSDTITVIHNNYTIQSGNSLTSVTIEGLLTLQSLLPPPVGPVLGPVPLPFKVSFLETPNSPASGICANGVANGVGFNINNLGGSACGDIFVIDVASLNFPFFYDSDGIGGGDPRQYFLSIFADNFDTLSDAACTSVLGVPTSGCRGFQTREGLSTPSTFKLLITGEPFGVPEPGTLALMGLGMASLGWIGRRRKQKQG